VLHVGSPPVNLSPQIWKHYADCRRCASKVDPEGQPRRPHRQLITCYKRQLQTEDFGTGIKDLITTGIDLMPGDIDTDRELTRLAQYKMLPVALPRTEMTARKIAEWTSAPARGRDGITADIGITVYKKLL